MIAEDTMTEALRTLIDARLDTIDRMLIGRVSRQERLDIVREVESQIFDQLGEHGSDPLTREQILAVLARLDPPEAYLPEEGGSSSSPPGRSPTNPNRRSEIGRSGVGPESRLPSRLALVSGWLGIVSIVGIPAAFLLIWAYGAIGGPADYYELAVFLVIGLLVASLLAAVVAVVLSFSSRLRSGMAVAGLVTGLIATIGSCLSMMWIYGEIAS